MSGSSVGMTYDKGRDAIAMLDRASMAMAPDTPDDPPVRITSGSAYFARADRYVRYERDFTLVSGARTLSSALATAYLTDDGARVETLEMRGQFAHHRRRRRRRARCARWRPTTSTSSSPPTAGRWPAPRWRAPGPGGRPSNWAPRAARGAIAGQWIDVRFAPDGATASGLTVRESVALTLPAAPKEPPRTITVGHAHRDGRGRHVAERRALRGQRRVPGSARRAGRPGSCGRARSTPRRHRGSGP